MKEKAYNAVAYENAEELIGKMYTFKSSPGMHPSLLKARVTANVIFKRDCLAFKVNSPRFMPTDKIKFCDIEEIKRGIRLAPQLVIFAVIAAAYALFSGYYWFLAFSPALFLRGINFYVAIIRKSGAPMIILSSGKKSADMLEGNIELALQAKQQEGELNDC